MVGYSWAPRLPLLAMRRLPDGVTGGCDRCHPRPRLRGGGRRAVRPSLRQLVRPRVRLLVLVLVPLLGSCRGPGAGPPQAEAARPLRGTIYMGIEINRDTTIDAELQRAVRQRLGALREAFHTLHPGVDIQPLILPEASIEREMLRRSRSGLSPDILLLEGRTAIGLHRLGLIRPVPYPTALTDRLEPALIARVRQSPHELMALPQALTPQLACFDRRRMAASPATLSELLQASSRGQRFGIGMDLLNLAWTLGALGALDPLASILDGGPVTAAERSAIGGWLLWLRSVDLQQRISLLASQERLNAGLADGSLDWITCRGTDIQRLRRSLGPRLGLAPLPEGPAGPPSPISRLRVLAFGTQSSPDQRRTAEALAAFATNPQMQRGLMLHTRELLPVNRSVPVPVEISTDLAALVAAQRQATQARSMAVLTRPREGLEAAVNAILARYIYGELEVAGATDALVAVFHSHAPR